MKKIFDEILRGRSDANIAFKDICNLLISLGFDLRIRGSHHIFRKDSIYKSYIVNISGLY